MVDPREAAVVLRRDGSADADLEQLAADASRTAGSGVAVALDWAVDLATRTPAPGERQTLLRWEILATVAAQDLTVARVIEPHLDAVAVAHEAGLELPGGSTWGVWAAEGGERLEATRTDGAWSLSGTKPWCSLAGVVSHALVTAWVGEDQRGLFAVDLRGPDVVVEPGTWAATGLVEVVTTSVTMRGVAAEPVGAPGWYLTRPGFAWGGIGVASIWFGGAVAVARRLADQARSREPDQVALLHLGEVDTALTAARAVLVEAATLVDEGATAGPSAGLLAARVRNVVAGAAETVLLRAAHGLGPGPLTQEPAHARRVADLSLYLRQHHAERDAAAAGRLLLQEPGSPW